MNIQISIEHITAGQRKIKSWNGLLFLSLSNEGLNFDTVVDIIKMKAYTYGEAGSKKVTENEIPAELEGQKQKLYRLELIEKVAETSEELMNKYFEDGTSI